MQNFCDSPPNAGLSLAVLNHLQFGIAVLDTEGSVVFANERALALFASAGVVTRTAGARLRFIDDAVERKFRRMLAQVGAGGATEAASDVLVLQRPRSTRMPLVVAVRGLSAEPPAGARLLLTFSDAADALSTTGIERLAEFFGLTPAEQRLTQYLASGGCLKGAAREFGVSPHTVRNQLRAVFEKSGVQRQADLTRLFMTGGSAHFPDMKLQHKPGRETPHAYH